MKNVVHKYLKSFKQLFWVYIHTFYACTKCVTKKIYLCGRCKKDKLRCSKTIFVRLFFVSLYMPPKLPFFMIFKKPNYFNIFKCIFHNRYLILWLKTLCPLLSLFLSTRRFNSSIFELPKHLILKIEGVVLNSAN